MDHVVAIAARVPSRNDWRLGNVVHVRRPRPDLVITLLGRSYLGTPALPGILVRSRFKRGFLPGLAEVERDMHRLHIAGTRPGMAAHFQHLSWRHLDTCR